MNMSIGLALGQLGCSIGAALVYMAVIKYFG